MSREELKEKIKSSTPFESFKSEEKVVNLLKKLGWRTIHGPFYNDTNTGKLRELDISAYKIWKVDSEEYGWFMVRLNLLIEIKSASGYHLLFSEDEVPFEGHHINDHALWPVYEGEFRQKVEEYFSKNRNLSSYLKTVKENYEDYITFGTGWLLPKMLVAEPIDIEHITSSFRETNIGNEKSLSNSVLWKGLRTLKSSLASIKKENFKHRFSDLEFEIDGALNLDEDIEKAFERAIKSESRFIEVFIPILVIDADLWMVKQNSLNEIPFCRFVQRNRIGGSNFNSLITNSDSTTEFFKRFTDFYANQYTEKAESLIDKIKEVKSKQ